MLCAIWYHLHNFKIREKHPWGSDILLVKLQVTAHAATENWKRISKNATRSTFQQEKLKPIKTWKTNQISDSF